MTKTLSLVKVKDDQSFWQKLSEAYSENSLAFHKHKTHMLGDNAFHLINVVQQLNIIDTFMHIESIFNKLDSFAMIAYYGRFNNFDKIIKHRDRKKLEAICNDSTSKLENIFLILMLIFSVL